MGAKSIATATVRTRRGQGVALSVLVAGLSVAMALLQAGSAATEAVIVILIIAAQIGAGWAFSADGKADPTLAERSVGRLFHLAQRAKRAGAKAQAAYESSGSEDQLHADMGILSVELSWIEDGLVQAIGDWRVFHAQAVERAEGADDA